MCLNLSGLKIYNSSAGSGKTYSLIKEYLLILFYSEDIYMYKHILVITFTNKVVKEIRLNILNKLNELSKGIKSDLFIFICNKLNKSSNDIELKAKNILQAIIHNYNIFSIYTIDKFYYKIIGNSNIKLYEKIKIELNTNYILKKSIKILLGNLNKSDFYSKLLIDFSVNETIEGKTWNPYNFLIKLSEFFIKEENISLIEELKKYSINDIILYNNIINNKITNIKKYLKNQSIFFFEELKKRNIYIKSFYRSLLPFFFEKLSNNNSFFNIENIFNKKLDQIIFNKKIYSKNIDSTQKKLINIFLKKIIQKYLKSKKYIYKYIFYSFLKKQILYTVTLYKLYKIIYQIKKEKNILFNIDVYQIINNKLNNNSILDMYENIGERYYHYFIDEFQDTSILQWNNIKPLIENALSENRTVLISGDIKQSIYRWRGSDITQFLKLINQNYNNFNKKIKYSYINYRSFKQIVKFNNLLYSSINQKFNNKKYEHIYIKNVKQENFKQNDGYVELNFLKSKKNYINNVYKNIKNKISLLLTQGYKAMEIAILVRKNEEALILSELFNSDGVSAYNSDYMLLKNFWQTKCIIGLFRIISYPDNIILRIKWLIYIKKLNKIKCDEENFHDLLSEISSLSIDYFFKKLSLYGIYFNSKYYLTSSILDITDCIIHAIKLNDKTSIIVIQFFMDFILKNIEKSGNSIYTFLKIWDMKKDKEYISLSENIDAIKIMTIHKSKGLEFPIVFLPFIYWKIFKEKDIFKLKNIYPNIFNKKNNNNIKKYYLLNLIINAIEKNYIQNIDKTYIDNINLLYVSTTRAIEQLIIFSYQNDNINNISFYLKNFLIKEKLFIKNKITYTFGKSEKKYSLYNNIENKTLSINYNKYNSYRLFNINFFKKDKCSNLNDSKLSDDLKYNSLIMIRYISNIDLVLKKIYYKYYFNKINVFELIKKEIYSIINNIDINIYFTNKYRVLFQYEIVFQRKIIKINRLIFCSNKVIIINYITNGSYSIHIEHTKNTIIALSHMGYKNIQAFFIFIKNTIKIINVF